MEKHGGFLLVVYVAPVDVHGLPNGALEGLGGPW